MGGKKKKGGKKPSADVSAGNAAAEDTSAEVEHVAAPEGSADASRDVLVAGGGPGGAGDKEGEDSEPACGLASTSMSAPATATADTADSATVAASEKSENEVTSHLAP